MRTPWGRKRRAHLERLERLERIVAARVRLRDIDGEELVGGTVENLYLAAKYGHGGQLRVDHPPGTFEFTTFEFTIPPPF